MTFYEITRQEHWLRDKQDEGKMLILNDDSTWEVNPRDQGCLPDFGILPRNHVGGLARIQ
jgi:hypothetical protein